MLLHRVFEDHATGKRYRVVQKQLSDLMLIDVDSEKAWPFPVSEEESQSAGLQWLILKKEGRDH